MNLEVFCFLAGDVRCWDVRNGYFGECQLVRLFAVLVFLFINMKNRKWGYSSHSRLRNGRCERCGIWGFCRKAVGLWNKHCGKNGFVFLRGSEDEW